MSLLNSKMAAAIELGSYVALNSDSSCLVSQGDTHFRTPNDNLSILRLIFYEYEFYEYSILLIFKNIII